MNKYFLIIMFFVSSLIDAQVIHERDYSNTIFFRSESKIESELGRLNVLARQDSSKLIFGTYKMKDKYGNSIFFNINKNGNLQDTLQSLANKYQAILQDGEVISETYYRDNNSREKVESVVVIPVMSYDSIKSKWEFKNKKVFKRVSYNSQDKKQKVLLRINGKPIADTEFYENGKIESDEVNYYYKKEFDSTGIITSEEKYNWSKKEWEQIIYKNGKILTSLIKKNNIAKWDNSGEIINCECDNTLKELETLTTFYLNGKPKTKEIKETNKPNIEIHYNLKGDVIKYTKNKPQLILDPGNN